MRKIAVLSLVLGVACINHVERRLVPAEHAATLDGKSEYLKAHLRSGSVLRPLRMACRLRGAGHQRHGERDFTIHVTNEALETQVIWRANLLALPAPSGGRVFATPDDAFSPRPISSRRRLVAPRKGTAGRRCPDAIAGELIAVRADTVWILPDGDRVAAVATSTVKQARWQRTVRAPGRSAGTRRWGWSRRFPTACFSC